MPKIFIAPDGRNIGTAGENRPDEIASIQNPQQDWDRVATADTQKIANSRVVLSNLTTQLQDHKDRLDTTFKDPRSQMTLDDYDSQLANISEKLKNKALTAGGASIEPNLVEPEFNRFANSLFKSAQPANRTTAIKNSREDLYKSYKDLYNKAAAAPEELVPQYMAQMQNLLGDGAVTQVFSASEIKQLQNDASQGLVKDRIGHLLETDPVAARDFLDSNKPEQLGISRESYDELSEKSGVLAKYEESQRLKEQSETDFDRLVKTEQAIEDLKAAVDSENNLRISRALENIPRDKQMSVFKDIISSMELKNEANSTALNIAKDVESGRSLHSYSPEQINEFYGKAVKAGLDPNIPINQIPIQKKFAIASKMQTKAPKSLITEVENILQFGSDENKIQVLSAYQQFYAKNEQLINSLSSDSQEDLLLATEALRQGADANSVVQNLSRLKEAREEFKKTNKADEKQQADNLKEFNRIKEFKPEALFGETLSDISDIDMENIPASTRLKYRDRLFDAWSKYGRVMSPSELAKMAWDSTKIADAADTMKYDNTERLITYAPEKVFMRTEQQIKPLFDKSKSDIVEFMEAKGLTGYDEDDLIVVPAQQDTPFLTDKQGRKYQEYFFAVKKDDGGFHILSQPSASGISPVSLKLTQERIDQFNDEVDLNKAETIRNNRLNTINNSIKAADVFTRDNAYTRSIKAADATAGVDLGTESSESVSNEPVKAMVLSGELSLLDVPFEAVMQDNQKQSPTQQQAKPIKEADDKVLVSLTEANTSELQSELLSIEKHMRLEGQEDVAFVENLSTKLQAIGPESIKNHADGLVQLGAVRSPQTEAHRPVDEHAAESFRLLGATTGLLSESATGSVKTTLKALGNRIANTKMASADESRAVRNFTESLINHIFRRAMSGDKEASRLLSSNPEIAKRLHAGLATVAYSATTPRHVLETANVRQSQVMAMRPFIRKAMDSKSVAEIKSIFVNDLGFREDLITKALSESKSSKEAINSLVSFFMTSKEDNAIEALSAMTKIDKKLLDYGQDNKTELNQAEVPANNKAVQALQDELQKAMAKAKPGDLAYENQGAIQELLNQLNTDSKADVKEISLKIKSLLTKPDKDIKKSKSGFLRRGKK